MAEGRTAAPALVWQQIRYQNRLFWRTPVAAFFTLVFPLMFLLLFSAIFGTDTFEITGRGVFSVAQFYAPALAVFAAASATYTNIGIGTAISRDEGILKRLRGTPLPPWAYMAGLIGSGVWIALIATTLMMTVGVVAFNVNIELAKMPAALVTFVTGSACFAALGLALAAASPTGDSAPAMANATILPLAFVSDVFIAIDNPPQWLTAVGNFFPLKHFVRAFQDAFHPLTESPAFRFEHLGVMAIWGVVGALLALKFFTWEPRQGAAGPRRRRRRSGGGEPTGSE
jgi:ABC-2 type transport system permease protein